MCGVLVLVQVSRARFAHKTCNRGGVIPETGIPVGVPTKRYNTFQIVVGKDTNNGTNGFMSVYQPNAFYVKSQMD